MMKSLIALALCALGAQAFPNLMEMEANLAKRAHAQPGCSTSALCNKNVPISDSQAGIPATPNAAQKLSAARTNCGSDHVCTTFNAAAQYVSNKGAHAYIKPSSTDIRGPCPGLNAAANHGYLPRSGLATIPQTIAGLLEAYSMSPDLSGFLAAYAVAFDGDIPTETWSIGGPIPQGLLGGLLSQPQGISYSHNNYEGDTSIGRCDAYLNGGDAHSLSTTRFSYAYASGMDNDRYTLDKFSRDFAKNTVRSESTNPYYFAPLFSTTLVAPAAYNFVINFMSNHSAAEPAGYLNGAIFKQFFGVTGDYPNFKWNPGQESIPNNWYKRPVLQAYNAIDVFGDLAVEFAAYPKTFRFGGNTNGVNTYQGIDISNFTGGTYDISTLFQGNNFACFFFQTEEQAIPQQLQGGVNDVAAAIALITKYAPNFAGKASCKPLSKYDSDVFTKYTGSSYEPTAPGSGPQNC